MLPPLKLRGCTSQNSGLLCVRMRRSVRALVAAIASSLVREARVDSSYLCHLGCQDTTSESATWRAKERERENEREREKRERERGKERERIQRERAHARVRASEREQESERARARAREGDKKKRERERERKRDRERKRVRLNTNSHAAYLFSSLYRSFLVGIFAESKPADLLLSGFVCACV